MGVILLSLNAIDVFSTFHAIDVLGFTELNPIAAGFPLWLSVLKFCACLIPLTCAYVLEKLEMRNYLFLPFAFSVVMVEFYASVLAFNVLNILGV